MVKCQATTEHGGKCHREARIGGYCIAHYHIHSKNQRRQQALEDKGNEEN